MNEDPVGITSPRVAVWQLIAELAAADAAENAEPEPTSVLADEPALSLSTAVLVGGGGNASAGFEGTTAGVVLEAVAAVAAADLSRLTTLQLDAVCQTTHTHRRFCCVYCLLCPLTAVCCVGCLLCLLCICCRQSRLLTESDVLNCARQQVHEALLEQVGRVAAAQVTLSSSSSPAACLLFAAPACLLSLALLLLLSVPCAAFSALLLPICPPLPAQMTENGFLSFYFHFTSFATSFANATNAALLARRATALRRRQ